MERKARPQLQCWGPREGSGCGEDADPAGNASGAEAGSGDGPPVLPEPSTALARLDPSWACTTHHACKDLPGLAKADGQLPTLMGPLHVDFGGEEMDLASEPQRMHTLIWPQLHP
ncbi:unnamed protein product [Rangifer tarandus platyrhynchus]|uniref:Uncharacterized protein n=1 Tax=Rangifer tarandus platyrhynchus TaxID=3082113 RepID=A0ABN8ZWE8_RANTA|nr:unnamed protein product [Rangifer tarandus platyrhynchus]